MPHNTSLTLIDKSTVLASASGDTKYVKMSLNDSAWGGEFSSQTKCSVHALDPKTAWGVSLGSLAIASAYLLFDRTLGDAVPGMDRVGLVAIMDGVEPMHTGT